MELALSCSNKRQQERQGAKSVPTIDDAGDFSVGFSGRRHRLRRIIPLFWQLQPDARAVPGGGSLSATRVDQPRCDETRWRADKARRIPAGLPPA
jgi:hypothetical protein